MKSKIERSDDFGSAKLIVDHPSDDLYMYLRISGAYFMLISFIIGAMAGMASSVFVYHYFIK